MSQATLATVRDKLTRDPAGFAALLADMQASTGAHGLIARAANRQLGKSDREAAGVLSSAQRHTHFLDSPRLVESTSASDFRFADLKERPGTVFLCLPPDRLYTYARWLRLLVAQAVTDMARSPARPERPVLFLLDEFAALGRLEPVERAMGLMAGYGLQLWPILQDMHQLRALYGERAGTFLSNAGVIQTFGVNDHATADMLSRTIGDTTLEYATLSTSRALAGVTIAPAPRKASARMSRRGGSSRPTKSCGCRPTPSCCCARANARSGPARSATMTSASSPVCSIRHDRTDPFPGDRTVSFEVAPYRPLRWRNAERHTPPVSLGFSRKPCGR
ncbi:conjugal transfer protein trag (plasmid) [Sphingobium cloacae]|uniref:Conjugal transfer protein TraG n=1 Tax=Sphingobium cloacae TaxID=120107 RepID=A0A1E1F8T8_9SPHN|nr:conjugal transfer protein TraG [Sphingobium cloacae]BAV66920.1 conjugal transfer protein TraG [Sphingobium cloacae]BAV67019.1 conjugal transfer protein trag [Sphingobium cloacae]